MLNFYSNIGKNTTNCSKMHYTCKSGNTIGREYQVAKRAFISMLKTQGYSDIRQSSNYVYANKDGECMTIYFAWHSRNNENYLVNKYICQRVDYFAFCTYDNAAIYLVSYDKVSKHCKTKNNSVTFNGSKHEKLFITDSWVQSQIAMRF